MARKACVALVAFLGFFLSTFSAAYRIDMIQRRGAAGRCKVDVSNSRCEEASSKCDGRFELSDYSCGAGQACCSTLTPCGSLEGTSCKDKGASGCTAVPIRGCNDGQVCCLSIFGV